MHLNLKRSESAGRLDNGECRHWQRLSTHEHCQGKKPGKDTALRFYALSVGLQATRSGLGYFSLKREERSDNIEQRSFFSEPSA